MTDRQTIILIDSTRRDRAINLIRNLPVDDTYEVVIQPKTKARGVDANALYWVRLTEIAEQAHVDGRKFSKEVFHEHCRQTIMPDMVTLKNGEVVSKWLETPTGSATVISTSLLSKKCFAEYVEAVESFGAGLGVMFSANLNERC